MAPRHGFEPRRNDLFGNLQVADSTICHISGISPQRPHSHSIRTTVSLLEPRLLYKAAADQNRPPDSVIGVISIHTRRALHRSSSRARAPPSSGPTKRLQEARIRPDGRLTEGRQALFSGPDRRSPQRPRTSAYRRLYFRVTSQSTIRESITPGPEPGELAI